MTELMNLNKCKITQIGLEFDQSMTFDEWQGVGKTLQAIHGSIQWWIGDWLRFGERKFGEMYAQAIDETGLDYGTLRNYKWVAENVDVSLRNDNLSWSCHKEVAKLEPDEQERVLKKAVKEGLHSKDIRDLVTIKTNRTFVSCKVEDSYFKLKIKTNDKEDLFEIPFADFVNFIDKYKK